MAANTKKNYYLRNNTKLLKQQRYSKKKGGNIITDFLRISSTGKNHPKKINKEPTLKDLVDYYKRINSNEISLYDIKLKDIITPPKDLFLVERPVPVSLFDKDLKPEISYTKQNSIDEPNLNNRNQENNNDNLSKPEDQEFNLISKPLSEDDENYKKNNYRFEQNNAKEYEMLKVPIKNQENTNNQ